METLKAKRVFHFSNTDREIVGTNSSVLAISTSSGHRVTSYEELLEKVSALNFHNPSLQLYFRGQSKDHFNYGKKGQRVRSSLYPSLLRSLPIKKSERRNMVEERLRKMKHAENLLKNSIQFGYVHKHRLVRWAILQHYGICETPLIDITSSLQIALSFAISGGFDEGFVYVFGFPHQTGPVTVSLESMTQIVDLSKLCPPEALRPHFQSALLAADYPNAIDLDELIRRVPQVSGNFSCRLLTKFHLKGGNSWIGDKFNPTHQEILFPDKRDRWFSIINDIKSQLNAQQG